MVQITQDCCANRVLSLDVLVWHAGCTEWMTGRLSSEEWYNPLVQHFQVQHLGMLPARLETQLETISQTQQLYL